MPSAVYQKPVTAKSHSNDAEHAGNVKRKTSGECGTKAGMPVFLQRAAAPTVSTPADNRQSGDNCEQNPVESSPLIQTRLTIGAADDPYEREADAVADRVMRKQPTGPISRLGSPGRGPTAQRQSEESGDEEKEEEEPVQAKLIQQQPEEEEPVQAKLVQRQPEDEEEPVQAKRIRRQPEDEVEEQVQTKALSSNRPARATGMASAASQAIHHKGAGSPLPRDIQQRLESSMGVDLADVRVHTGSHADQSTRALRARAFTHRNDIWLGRNESPGDLRLMAHEVAHVLQQDRGVRRKTDPGQYREKEENRSSAATAEPITYSGPTATEADRIKTAVTEPAQTKSAPVSSESEPATREQGEKNETLPPSDVNGKKNFHAVIKRLGKLSKQQQGAAASSSTSKKATTQAVKNASNSTPKPLDEDMAYGKGRQVNAIAKAEKTTGKISREDKKGFIKLVRKQIDKINMPKTELEHAIFIASDGPARFKKGVVENVNKKNTKIKSQLQNTTKENPKPVAIAEPETLKKQPAAPVALNIQSANVLPPPKALHEVSMEKDRSAFYAKNEDAGITTEKLEKANDPRFTAAREAIDEYDQNTAAIPGNYAAIEGTELDKEKTAARTSEMAASGIMRAKRIGTNKQIHGDQDSQTTKEYNKRRDVKTRLENIYKKTRDSVLPKLTGLEGRVKKCFDDEESIITLKFNSFVSTELSKFKKKRYSGVGKVKWLWDKTLGDVNELSAVKKIYRDGVKLYVDLLGKLIDKIAGVVVDTLNSCHKEIDDGIKAINKEIKALKDTKDTTSMEAAKDVLERFSDLRNKVTDKKNELANTLANKYQNSRKKMNAALEKFREQNRSYREKAERFIDKVKEAYRQFKARLSKILARARSAIQDILDDPIQFLKNMLKAVYQGFNQFKNNIVKHLKTAIFDWMFGSFSRAGVSIQIPKDFSAKSVFGFIMQVLGFTKEWILSRIARVIGRRNVALLEKVHAHVKQLLIQGPAEMYAELKEKVGNLKDTIIDEVRSWTITQIIKAAIIKLVTMFNPAGAIVQAVLTIVDVVMIFANNIDLILKVLETIVDSVYKVVKGKIQAAANMIENALAMGLSLAIRFMARFARLSGIVGKIRSIMKRFKRRITRAVDKGLKKIASKVGGLFGKGKTLAKKAAGKIVQWWNAKKSFKNTAGETHTIKFKGRGSAADLIVESTPATVKKFMQDAGIKPSHPKYNQVLSLVSQIKTITRSDKKKNPITRKESGQITQKISQLSKLLASLDTAGSPDLPTKAEWKFTGGSNKSSKVDKLSTRTSKPGSKPSGSTEEFDFLRNHGLTKKGDKWVRMHLISEQIGGIGEPKNWVPAPNSVNTGARVRNFEVSVENLVKQGNKKKPNVLWVSSRVTGTRPKLPKYNNLPDFPKGVSFRAGLYLPRKGNWVKNNTTRIRESVLIAEPEGGDVAKLSTASYTELSSVHKIFTRSTVNRMKEHVRPYKSKSDFITQLKNKDPQNNLWQKKIPLINNVVTDLLAKNEVKI